MKYYSKILPSPVSRHVKWLLAILLVVCLTGWSGDNKRDKNENERTQKTTEYKRHHKDTETNEQARFFQRATKKPRSEISKAIHEARRSGNLERIKQLEAQIRSKMPRKGESQGTATIRRSSTVGYPGQSAAADGHQSNGAPPVEWGTDIHVRSVNTDFRESHPAMATTSDGTIYCVWENVGQSGTNDYLQFYYSTDGGDSWNALGFIENPNFNIRSPSLAVGEGTENLLVCAYVVDDGVVPFVEVMTTPLVSAGGWNPTMTVPAYLSFWESYEKPVVWTDSYDWNGWYIYLTAEAAFDAANNNYNIVFWRSIDFGATLDDPHQTILGDFDNFAWRDPDGTYGTTGNDIYVACFNATDNTLYHRISTSFGSSFADTVAINLVDPLPFNAVDPDIEAAANLDNLMLCCTKSFSGNDNPAQTYSTDGGFTWSSLFSLEGYTDVNEFAIELTANEGGNNWHVCYTTADWWVYYSTRPQDLSDFWQAVPDQINDIDWASAAYPKKAITSNWDTDEVGIAWSDYRQGSPDYDIYFDHLNNVSGIPDILVSPTSLTINETANNISVYNPVFNQENVADLFEDISPREKRLTERQGEVKENYESLFSTIELRLVKANTALLQRDAAVRLTLFNSQKVTAARTRIVRRAPND